MIRPAVVLGGWAAWLAVLGLVLLAFGPTQYQWALLVGGSLALVPLGALLLLPGGRGEPRPLPDTSLPTVIVAAGIVLLVLGLAAGLWLLLVGAEVLALGAAALFRELRAQRGTRRS